VHRQFVDKLTPYLKERRNIQIFMYDMGKKGFGRINLLILILKKKS
jgi:hypothetical protein